MPNFKECRFYFCRVLFLGARRAAMRKAVTRLQEKKKTALRSPTRAGSISNRAPGISQLCRRDPSWMLLERSRKSRWIPHLADESLAASLGRGHDPIGCTFPGATFFLGLLCRPRRLLLSPSWTSLLTIHLSHPSPSPPPRCYPLCVPSTCVLCIISLPNPFFLLHTHTQTQPQSCSAR